MVLLDLRMPGCDGVRAARRCASAANPARVLVITSFTDPAAVLPAMRAGAAGYVYKDVDPPALATAIRAVHAGHVLLNPDVAGLLAGGGPDPAGRPADRTGAGGADRGGPRAVEPGDRGILGCRRRR